MLQLLYDKRQQSPVIEDLCARLELLDDRKEKIESMEERFNEIEKAFSDVEVVADANLGELTTEMFEKFTQALANAKMRNKVLSELLGIDLNDLDAGEADADEFLAQLVRATKGECPVCEAKL